MTPACAAPAALTTRTVSVCRVRMTALLEGLSCSADARGQGEERRRTGTLTRVAARSARAGAQTLLTRSGGSDRIQRERRVRQRPQGQGQERQFLVIP